MKEQNYGADWGDFVSFTRYEITLSGDALLSDDNCRHMKRQADKLGVDLLLIDTGILQSITLSWRIGVGPWNLAESWYTRGFARWSWVE